MKKLVSTFLCICLVLTLVAFGSPRASAEETAPASDPVNLVYSISGTPGSPQCEAMYRFEEEVERISNGNITVDCYDSGTLVGQNDELEAVIAGDIDICQTTAAWLANDASPWISMFSMAYLFNSREHMEAVMGSEIGDNVYARVLDEQGLYVVSTPYIGRKAISLIFDRKVSRRADLEGVIFRMAGTSAYQYMGRALGGNPAPLAFSEIYLGLQTGTVEGQDNSLASTVSVNLQEVLKSITLSYHVYDAIWVVINENSWAQLSDQQKEWVTEAMQIASDYAGEITDQLEVDALETLADAGVTIYDLTDEERLAYADEVRAYYLADEEMTSTWDMDLYEEIINFEY